MKYLKYLACFIISLLFIVTSVKAATITDATYDTSFKVNGTGTESVQIAIFNPDNTAIYMTTTSITNGVYDMTLPKIDGITPGNYTIKVADYDGQNVDTKTVTISSSIDEAVPNTSDNIIIPFIIGIISILGITGYIVILKRK